ncbi:MKRN2 opposite strand protein isoform X1 [Dermacentor andersoni]|uniref:MKRN2 opposite strand protein isoform X1 n=1 Tax=Dermacentor andersoni TaxID=34620 RepID=UPI002417FFC4|nr:MKRN2 opposite strand protein-like isoform X1 [Dermacentor andersoni]XP_054921983.1 MKRN2 opposite strand protein-like isoform X1 [Dermacentor andersoni]XP_054921984.1 MKRN2 opposite strand protein-like isoform X1 [Dermacentor andersoni]XP_054921985.1 MKRN2 opposite strand protein-like isoform X1 [Dermacentor andersoni]XP_054921986.1 MKRN2 opposite strand protein-like isoform X1 [Dermacentor andersoni]
MDDQDLAILCFQHCEKRANVLCLRLPKCCPICGLELENAELRVPPFRIPYPFRNTQKSPCCVVIKPSKGDFLHLHSSSLDLHTGVTDSNGQVHEYDKEGLKVAKQPMWSQCIAVPVITDEGTAWHEFWDYTLSVTESQDAWDSKRYNETEHNCYSFVIAFLRNLQIPQLRPSLKDKLTFSSDFLVPKTRNVARYIALYRKLLQDEFTERCQVCFAWCLKRVWSEFSVRALVSYWKLHSGEAMRAKKPWPKVECHGGKSACCGMPWQPR